MNAGLESLHKVLKDTKRRKIILALNEKGSLSYTEILSAAEVSSTGTLNYHLKILSDLLTKDDKGQYLLTERGKLASKLLLEYPEQQNQEQVKRVWWRRFWVASIVFETAILIFGLTLYFLGYASLPMVLTGIFGFVIGICFIYFFYRMIRPLPSNSSLTQSRTIENIFVADKNLQQVKQELHHWIADTDIAVEVERNDFIRGRLGIPSGLGLTAPKYFEVSFKSDGVLVHLEGWISLFDVSERCFTNSILSYGNIPRRKGYKVTQDILMRLKALSGNTNVNV